MPTGHLLQLLLVATVPSWLLKLHQRLPQLRLPQLQKPLLHPLQNQLQNQHLRLLLPPK